MAQKKVTLLHSFSQLPPIPTSPQKKVASKAKNAKKAPNKNLLQKEHQKLLRAQGKLEKEWSRLDKQIQKIEKKLGL